MTGKLERFRFVVLFIAMCCLAASLFLECPFERCMQESGTHWWSASNARSNFRQLIGLTVPLSSGLLFVTSLIRMRSPAAVEFSKFAWAVLALLSGILALSTSLFLILFDSAPGVV